MVVAAAEVVVGIMSAAREAEKQRRERDRAAIGASEELEWTAMRLAQAISSGSSHRGDDVAGWRPQEGIG